MEVKSLIKSFASDILSQTFHLFEVGVVSIKNIGVFLWLLRIFFTINLAKLSTSLGVKSLAPPVISLATKIPIALILCGLISLSEKWIKSEKNKPY